MPDPGKIPYSVYRLNIPLRNAVLLTPPLNIGHIVKEQHRATGVDETSLSSL